MYHPFTVQAPSAARAASYAWRLSSSARTFCSRGSSDLAANLAEHGLIDEYRIMVNPILLEDGKPLLKGLGRDVPLKLLQARPFKHGNVLLSYAPEGAGR